MLGSVGRYAVRACTAAAAAEIDGALSGGVDLWSTPEARLVEDRLFAATRAKSYALPVHLFA